MPDVSSISALEARLQSLERQVRSQKRLLVAAIAALAVAVGAGAAGAAQRTFTIADAAGHKRISIDAKGLQVFDASGKRRIFLGMDGYGKPGLFLERSKGDSPIGMYVSPKGLPLIRIADAKNDDRAFFGLTQSSRLPYIDFLDTKGTERLFVGLSTSSNGLVRDYSAAGTTLTSLEHDKVWVSNGNGDERAYLGTADDGNGMLKLYDASSRERVFMGTYTDGTSGFQAEDANGNVTWSSP